MSLPISWFLLSKGWPFENGKSLFSYRKMQKLRKNFFFTNWFQRAQTDLVWCNSMFLHVCGTLLRIRTFRLFGGLSPPKLENTFLWKRGFLESFHLGQLNGVSRVVFGSELAFFNSKNIFSWLSWFFEGSKILIFHRKTYRNETSQKIENHDFCYFERPATQLVHTQKSWNLTCGEIWARSTCK